MRASLFAAASFLVCSLVARPSESRAPDVPVPSSRPIPVRVLGARWQGALPADEAGTWDLGTASLLVDNLNAMTKDVGLSFALERAAPIDVTSKALARIGESSDAAARAFTAYQATGQVSNRTLTIVVVGPSETSWVGGWGNQDQPLGVAGSWPMIQVSTRIARNKQAHWIAHELGHVMGLYDVTYYEDSARSNAPYTRCGLSIPSRTIPRAGAPLGARQNVMSYDVDERVSFVTDGYAANRQIIECWVRAGSP